MLTGKLCLMEAGDRLGAAGASDGDLLLPAVVLHIILRKHKTTTACK